MAHVAHRSTPNGSTTGKRKKTSPAGERIALMMQPQTVQDRIREVFMVQHLRPHFGFLADERLKKAMQLFYSLRMLEGARKTEAIRMLHKVVAERARLIARERLMGYGISRDLIDQNLRARWESKVPFAADRVNAQGDRKSFEKSADVSLWWGNTLVFVLQTKFPTSCLNANSATAFHGEDGEALGIRNANPSAVVYQLGMVPAEALNAKKEKINEKATTSSTRDAQLEQVWRLKHQKWVERQWRDNDVYFGLHFLRFHEDYLALKHKKKAAVYVANNGAVLDQADHLVATLVQDLVPVIVRMAKKIAEHVHTGAPLLVGNWENTPSPATLKAFRQMHNLSLEQAQGLMNKGDWASFEQGEGFMTQDCWDMVRLRNEDIKNGRPDVTRPARPSKVRQRA